MRNTHIFRQAIKEAMIKHGVTFRGTYTDRVKGDKWDSRRRRVCWYECRIYKADPRDFEAFGRMAAAAGAYMTGVWTAVDGTIFFNVRGLIE